MFGPMNQDDDRDTCIARRQRQPSRQRHSAALETRVDLDQRYSPTGEFVETNFATLAVGDRDSMPIGPPGPAERAGPATFALRRQLTRASIRMPPSQFARLAGGDIQRCAIRHQV